jgi:hypothetical protein
MSQYLMEMIGYEVEGTAEWRRRKAEEFSQDTRNLEAAEQLERLAAEIEELKGSEIETQISELQEHCQNHRNFDWLGISVDVSDELRSVGFSGGWSNATELLQWYRDLLKEKLLKMQGRESCLRRKAKRRGYAIYKSRERKHVPHSNNFGEYMLVDDRRGVVLGDKYDASLDDIEDYLVEHDQARTVEQAGVATRGTA